MSGYPDCETYKALYKRFYDGRRPEELLDLAGDLKGKVVLDLCAGDGRLSLDALLYGAKKVILIEQERKMLGKTTREVAGKNPSSLNIYFGRLQDYLKVTKSSFNCDIVFCQQGVNYWLDNWTALMIANILGKNGVFVFNTFSKKPPEIPIVKEYELEGKKFVEVSWLVGDIVHHVQIREGMEPHTTAFRWLSTTELESILRPYFNFSIQFQNNTSIWCCSKK